MQKAFPTQLGYYSDVGYRYKKNIFTRSDDIFFQEENVATFFSFETYIEDTFKLSKQKS